MQAFEKIVRACFTASPPIQQASTFLDAFAITGSTAIAISELSTIAVGA